MSNTRYIIGTITIIGVVGVTIYAIKKSRDLKKAEEESMTVEEAQQFVRNHAVRERAYDDEFYDGQTLDEFHNDVHDEINFNASFGVYNYKEPVSMVNGIPAEDFRDAVHDEVTNDPKVYEDDIKSKGIIRYDGEEDDFDEEDEIPEEHQPIFETYNEPNLNELQGEMEKLRHDPNSDEAVRQYIQMELAEWLPDDDTYQTMERLYHIPFTPENQGDRVLLTKLVDYRVQFFGFNSKWNKLVTIGDIILHFARLAEYNIGENVRYWVNYFLEFNELDHIIDGYTLNDTILSICKHTYYNDKTGTFGVFGLTNYHMEEAIRIAEFNSIYKEVTFEIEFNEFLKSCL